MLTLASLADTELSRRLNGTGLQLATGPVTFRIRSRIAGVARGIRLLYGAYPLADDGFADFHVSLGQPAGLRRWFRPQVLFRMEGSQPFKPLPLEQAFPMLEWGMNWCVSQHAHSYLMIHAAVVESGGRVAVLPAPPGSGKSTLCAGLVARGWRLLSDEITLIRLGDGAIIPMPRPVSLKNASIDIIRAFAPGAVISPPVHDTVKGTVAHMRVADEAVARAGEAAMPGWIVFPKYVAEAPADLLPLSRARAFVRMVDNAFNYELLGTDGFDALANLVDASGCFEFSYGNLNEAIEVFAGLRAQTAPHPDSHHARVVVSA